MRLPIPNSIAQLLFTGFALVAIPLVIALVATFAQVNRLADQSRTSIVGAIDATRSSRILQEQLTAMERAYRQYALTGETSLLDIYRESRARLLGALDALDALNIDAQYAQLVADFRGTESAIHEDLHLDRSSTQAQQRAVTQFAALNAATRDLVRRSASAVEAQAGRSIAASARLINVILLQAGAMMVAALLLAMIFITLIIRPLRQVENSIRQLGRADYDTPIEVHGPRDIQEIGDQLEWLRRRIFELENQKKLLLRHISHELKTPLTSIREGADLLAEADEHALGAENRRIVAILQKSSVRLQGLIENLLEAVKSDSIGAPASLGPIAVKPVIETVISEQYAAIAAKAIDVRLACANIEYRIDANQLSIIIDNLLSNAIRFSPRAGVITLEVNADAAGIVIEIGDEGPGIAPHEVDRIFEPFYTGAPPQAGKVGGTGLGLSIVSDYVTRRGGTIESRPGTGGARFRITLPH